MSNCGLTMHVFVTLLVTSDLKSNGTLRHVECVSGLGLVNQGFMNAIWSGAHVSSKRLHHRLCHSASGGVSSSKAFNSGTVTGDGQ